MEGVDGSTVPDKSPPFATEELGEEDQRNRRIGSWRGHVNFIRTIVEDRLSSALIFEDDQDMDIDIKTQLSQIAVGTRFLSTNSSSPSTIPHSPYGDAWDLLWIGHCGTAMDSDSPRFIIENDPSVPIEKHRMNFGERPNMTYYGPNSRTVFRAKGGLCTYAYALSYQGAQKLLYRQITRTKWDAFDIDVHNACKDDSEFKCFSVFPQITSSHWAQGPTDRDSDLSPIKDSHIRQKGMTGNIVTSVRLNVMNLLQGRPVEKQHPEDQPELEGPIRTWVDDVHRKKESLSVDA